MRRCAGIALLSLLLPLQAAATPAPGFEAKTLAGTTVRLQDYRGQFVLLDFWSSWCGACRAELPRLAVLEREVDGLVVLTVNLGEEPERIRGFAGKVTLPRHVLLDPEGAIAERFAVPALPWQVLVDPSGSIVRQGRRVHDGAAALRREIAATGGKR